MGAIAVSRSGCPLEVGGVPSAGSRMKERLDSGIYSKEDYDQRKNGQVALGRPILQDAIACLTRNAQKGLAAAE